MDNNEMTLATELLHELKASAKRWFVAFVVMVILELATIAGFIWYISLPVEEYAEIYNEDGNANYIGNDMNGDLYNGTDKNLSETENNR